MDPVTHALTGYVISNSINSPADKEKRTANAVFTLAAMTAAVFPDIDFVVRHFGSNTLYFMYHRTITHSPPALIFFSLIIALFARLIFKQSRFSTLLIGTLLGSASHVLLDLTNTYSTLALWPFTNKMYGLNLMSIVDIYVIGIYSAAILISFLKLLKPHRQKIFISAIIAVICLIGAKAFIQTDLKSFLLKEYYRGSISNVSMTLPIRKISVMPEFFGINSWYFIVENDREFIKGYIFYPLHKYSEITSIEKKKDDILIRKVQETPLGEFLLRFSPYLDYKTTGLGDKNLVQMIDLRYSFRLVEENSNIKIDSRNIGIGGYFLLDSQNNVTYWGIEPPPEMNKF